MTRRKLVTRVTQDIKKKNRGNKGQHVKQFQSRQKKVKGEIIKPTKQNIADRGGHGKLWGKKSPEGNGSELWQKRVTGPS